MSSWQLHEVHTEHSLLRGATTRVVESGPPLPRRFPPLLDELHGSVDGRFQDGGIERGGDGVEDRPFEGLLGHVQVVSAHGGPRLLL